MTDTLAVDRWAVTIGTAKRMLVGMHFAESFSSCTNQGPLYQLYIYYVAQMCDANTCHWQLNTYCKQMLVFFYVFYALLGVTLCQPLCLLIMPVCCDIAWQRMYERNSLHTTAQSDCTMCVCLRSTCDCSARRRPTTMACWSGKLANIANASCRQLVAAFCLCIHNHFTHHVMDIRCVHVSIWTAMALDAEHIYHCSLSSCR